MSKLVFGVIGTSKKENKLRMPIHPEHINRIPGSILPLWSSLIASKAVARQRNSINLSLLF